VGISIGLQTSNFAEFGCAYLPQIIVEMGSSFVSKKALIHSFWVAIATACVFCILDGNYRLARAGEERVVVNMPVYGEVVHSELAAQAESLIRDALNRQFSQRSNLSTVQVDVVGDRHGELIPLLTVTVSRAQWQANPQVSAWGRYYSASYTLLQRYESDTAVAIALARAATSMDASVQDRFRIDEAFDSGHLTGPAAQDYLSYLD
jgi:hypothetical protein